MSKLGELVDELVWEKINIKAMIDQNGELAEF